MKIANLAVVGVLFFCLIAQAEERPQMRCRVKLSGAIGHRFDLTLTNNFMKLNLEQDFFKPFVERKLFSGFIGLGKLAEAAVHFAWHSGNPAVIERKDKVDFTHAYLDNSQCVIVKKDKVAEFTTTASLQGKKAAAESGSAGESYAKSVTDADKVVGKGSQMDTFIDLKSGAVDFIVVDALLAETIVGKGDYADLAIASAIEIDAEVYSIGCRKGSDLDDKINEALVELLNEGKIEALATKYDVHVTKSLMDKKTAK